MDDPKGGRLDCRPIVTFPRDHIVYSRTFGHHPTLTLQFHHPNSWRTKILNCESPVGPLETPVDHVMTFLNPKREEYLTWFLRAEDAILSPAVCETHLGKEAWFDSGIPVWMIVLWKQRGTLTHQLPIVEHIGSVIWTILSMIPLNFKLCSITQIQRC